MVENPYFRIRGKIEHRLSKPRGAILNAVLFTVYTVFAGFGSLMMSSGEGINPLIHISILLWSIVLALHTGRDYLRSGAWTGAREKAIQQEVLEAGETLNLSEDEMIDLHQQLAEDVAARAQPLFNKAAVVAAVNILLWDGVLAGILVYSRFASVSASSFTYFTLLALVGTLLVGFTLPIGKVLREQRAREDLRAIYGKQKRKRQSELYAPEAYLSIRRVDDEGEVAENSENSSQRRTLRETPLQESTSEAVSEDENDELDNPRVEKRGQADA
jgi:hypothetical protein